MKRRLYPVVKNGSRFFLVSSMSVVGTLLATFAMDLAIYHGNFAEALRHVCLGLTGNTMLLTLPMIALTAFIAVWTARIVEQDRIRRLMAANQAAPLLAAGDQGGGIEAG